MTECERCRRKKSICNCPTIKLISGGIEMKSFDPKKVEVQVHKEFEKYSDPYRTIIKETLDNLVLTAINLQRNLASLYGCEIEDTEIILNIKDETKLTMAARLKNDNS